MKSKYYNGYASSFCAGSFGRFSLGPILFYGFLISIISLVFWTTVDTHSTYYKSTSIINIIMLLTLSIALIAFSIYKTRKVSQTTTTTLDMMTSINKSRALLDIIPVDKKLFITTHCITNIVHLLMMLLFIIVGFLSGNDSKLLGLRGLILILSILSVSIHTYCNIKNFKVVSEFVPNLKKENTVLSIIITFLPMTIIIFFDDFISILFESFTGFFETLVTFIENFFVFKFFGNFYVGIFLLTLTVWGVIYFNYHYLVKEKTKNLDKITNWREL